MRPYSEYEAAAVLYDRDSELGIDDERGPGAAGPPARRERVAGGERGDLGPLEDVLLCAVGGPERDPRQGPAGQEPTRPQG